MEKISTFVDGKMLAVPVLTPQHLIAVKKIRAGKDPECPENIIDDLVQIGWLEDSYGQN